MYYYLAAIVTLVSYILYKCYVYPFYLSPLRKIPGPPFENFFIGNYASFLKKEPAKAFIQLKKQHGEIFRYHSLFNDPHIVISDPKLVQQVLVNRSYEFSKYQSKAVLKDIFGNGILVAEGDSHKRQRKMMTPSFSFTNIKEMFPTFVQAGNKLKDIWMKQIGIKKEERITITDLIPKITLDVIGLIGFNYEFNSTTSSSELAQAYKVIFSRNPPPAYVALVDLFPIIRKLPIPYNNKFYDAVKIVNDISEKLIAEQKNSPIQGKDLLALLVKANENLPVDERLKHDELIGQVMTLLIGGHETTSTALFWAVYFLAKNPDIQDRLRKELIDAFTDRNHQPTLDEIEHLKYLECVLKETLRIMPPVQLLRRRPVKDEILNGYIIPKGTPLMIPVYAIHHDPLIWGEDVENFNPSRWLDPKIKSKISTSTFLPFGAGPKNCIGLKIAQLEFKTVLSILIRNFEFRIIEGFTFKKKSVGFPKPIPGIDLWVSKIED
ncbi:cytochrome P450 [Gigaspora margarita]|uniref:Cytochrome P450 n=1 Tax=Gigaspora margarita TaxID=4874 RepID=A0A8H4AU07_GIGMA|nr:cytochrome P450 [Gigaspora margarita]